MKKISIIISVYNASKYIVKCLDSIYAQTYKNIEVIALNDGSTDDSYAKLKKYKKKHKDLIIINKENEKIFKTRNKGIKIATGDYLLFIDNDDYIDKDYIESFIKELDDDYDIIIDGYRKINDKKKILFKSKLKDNEYSKYVIISPWAKLYKAAFIKEHQIEFLDYGIGGDAYFNLYAYSFNPKIKIINYIGYNWYYNSKSVSNTDHKKITSKKDLLYLLNRINKAYKSPDKLLKYYYNKNVIWYLLYLGRDSSPKQFIDEYNRLNKWLHKNKLYVRIKPFSKDFQGELFKNKIYIFIFQMIEKFHLLGLFSKLYCKGKSSQIKNEKIEIFIATQKKIAVPKESIYIPIQVGAKNKENIGYIKDSSGDNISSMNPRFCELTASYWIWKNSKADIVGLVHYRRYFFKKNNTRKLSNVLTATDIAIIMQQYDIIIPKRFQFSNNIDNRQHYENCHYIKDYDKCRDIISRKYPDYLEAFDAVAKRNYIYPYNMFITKKEILDKYAEWLFDILFEIDKCIDISEYSNYNKRACGFLGERLFNVWLKKNNSIKMKEIIVYNTEGFLKKI